MKVADRGQNCCHSRAAITIVELLVVLGVVSLLLSLLAPAVQSAREAAHNAACMNNLRQVGMACESFVISARYYPPYIQYHTQRNISGHCHLLPFLDQENVHSKIDFSEGASALQVPIDSTKNRELINVDIPVFRCPSDPSATGGTNSYRACFGTTTGIHATLKWGQKGTETFWHSMWGILLMAGKPARIVDGMSNTILYSERVVGDFHHERFSPAQDVAYVERQGLRYPDDATQACRQVTTDSHHFSGSGGTWLIGHRSHTAYNHVLPPNSSIPDCVEETLIRELGSGAVSARSYHRGAVNACFADISVRSINGAIDLSVWRSLATYNGREVVGEF